MKIKPLDSSAWYAANGDQTLRLNYPHLNEQSVVVDVGARHGDWAGPIKQKYNCNVYCFDVIEEFVNDLLNKGFTAYKYAISNTNGYISMGITESEASIFHDENAFSVECIDTKSMFEKIEEQSIDLLKMNIEGSEYDVVEDLLNQNLIKNIAYLQIQFHAIENFENRYSNICDRLSQTHELQWRYPFIWESWKLKNL
jgi:FkbM family methyltransferase